MRTCKLHACSILSGIETFDPKVARQMPCSIISIEKADKHITCNSLFSVLYNTVFCSLCGLRFVAKILIPMFTLISGLYLSIPFLILVIDEILLYKAESSYINCICCTSLALHGWRSQARCICTAARQLHGSCSSWSLSRVCLTFVMKLAFWLSALPKEMIDPSISCKNDHKLPHYHPMCCPFHSRIHPVLRTFM